MWWWQKYNKRITSKNEECDRVHGYAQIQIDTKPFSVYLSL